MVHTSEQTPADSKAAFGDPDLLPHGEDNLSPIAQLRRMQRVLFRITQQPNVDKREAAQCALAWERLEARKAVMMMRPAPKAIDVADLERAKERRRAARQGAAEASWRPKRKVVAMPEPPATPQSPEADAKQC